MESKVIERVAIGRVQVKLKVTKSRRKRIRNM